MKFKSLYVVLLLSVLMSSHFVVANDVLNQEIDRQEQLQEELEDKFTKAVQTKNKAQILGYIKQDPSLLFIFVEYDDFLDNSDKTIRMFTTMKKAGVNLNYQDEYGHSILHFVIEALAMQTLLMPIIGAVFNSIGNTISKLFVGIQDEEDEQNQESLLLSESELVLKIQNTQKIVQALLKLGVKKHLKTYDDHKTAADYVKEYIDEGQDEFAGHPVMKELQKLYKMLK